MKVVKIKREANQDVVKTLEHALKLARLGEITGIVGALRLKNGLTRKILHGVFVDDIPRAIGELETVKMWIYEQLEQYDVVPREEEIRQLNEDIEKENDTEEKD